MLAHGRIREEERGDELAQIWLRDTEIFCVQLFSKSILEYKILKDEPLYPKTCLSIFMFYVCKMHLFSFIWLDKHAMASVHICVWVCVCVCSYAHIVEAVYNHLPACGDSAAYDLSNSLH